MPPREIRYGNALALGSQILPLLSHAPPLRLYVVTDQGVMLYALWGRSKAARTYLPVPGELWTKQNIWLIDRAAFVATDR